MVRCLRLCPLMLLLMLPLLNVALPASVLAKTSDTGSSMPVADPNYIYHQLEYMSTSFQKREAGYDANLPINQNGHDEFAHYWSQEISRNLQGFAPQVRNDPFSIRGWRQRPAVVPAVNVEVSVPGVVHPEQVMVIGCHYDGEAISNQSAYDDASGCAIELGVAKAMADYWRAHHSYPARTLRFVIFDAEEQGLFGSYHYVNETINGDVQNIVGMINEEQNGINYPLRYLGQATNPLLPYYLDVSPLTNNALYPDQKQLAQPQKDRIAHFRSLVEQALPAVFAEFRSLGYQQLTYHGANQKDVAQPIFTPDQLSNLHVKDDTLGSSDQVPFTLAGLPCLTMVGNSAPDANGKPSPLQPAYPFDTSYDTVQLMNTYADGNSQQSMALTMALALPTMITGWLLSQSDILGMAPMGGGPVVAISDVGMTKVGQPLSLDAHASLSSEGGAAALSYHWDFGDGETANGISVKHIYARAGSYTLRLSSSDTKGTTTVSKAIVVIDAPTQVTNDYEHLQLSGIHRTFFVQPQPNSAFTDDVLPNSLRQAVLPAVTPTAASGKQPAAAASQTNSSALLWFVLPAIVLLIVVGGGIGFFVLRKKQARL